MSEFEIFEQALSKFNYLQDDEKPKKNEKKAWECCHENKIDDNNIVLCIDCGEEISKNILHDKEWRYYGQVDSKNSSDPNRVQYRKYDERNIYKDVENMGFGDKIVSIANNIYMQVTNGKIKRGNSRKAIVFACIYQAYILSDSPKTHDALIRIFNLTKKNGLQGLKHVKLNTPKGHEIHLVHITPIHLIKDIMEKFNAKEYQKEQIINLYKEIKNKDTKLNRARPQSIAAGITYYWICSNRIEIKLKEFSVKVNLSENTIGKMAKLIANILGEPLIMA